MIPSCRCSCMPARSGQGLVHRFYLEMADFEKGVEAIGEVCERVRDGKWREEGERGR